MKKIPVRRGGIAVAYALVSDEDYDRLMQSRWSLTRSGYAVRSDRLTGSKTQGMHRAVYELGQGDERVVHHLNEDKLDNRRENLEVLANRMAHANTKHPIARARVRAAFDKSDDTYIFWEAA